MLGFLITLLSFDNSITMKKLILMFFLTPIQIFAQEKVSNVEFEGSKTIILHGDERNFQVSGILSTGEKISTFCSHGACFFRIEYKGRSIEQTVGYDITDLTIYEYDFGGDGDKELVVINNISETSFIYIYSYSRGIISELFEKEIKYYQAIIKVNYIEYYMPSGLDTVWNYYQGKFWKMTPVRIEK